ncbi:MAG TPA: hypothetical protein VGL62_01255, partial [Vicinamibacterales bacterium]
REGPLVVLKFRPDTALDPAYLLRLVQQRPDIQLAPPATLKLDLKVPETGRGAVRGRRPGASGSKSGTGASWWTTRATAGEVTAGFSRDEILRPVKEDPRAEGGVFSRVSGLLRDLSEGVGVS